MDFKRLIYDQHGKKTTTLVVTYNRIRVENLEKTRNLCLCVFK